MATLLSQLPKCLWTTPFLAQVLRFCTIYRRQTSFLFEMLWIELRVSYMLGKHSTTELYSCPSIFSVAFVHLFICLLVCLCVSSCASHGIRGGHQTTCRRSWCSPSTIWVPGSNRYHQACQQAPLPLGHLHGPLYDFIIYVYILCTSGAYVYHYYIHTMAQGEARGQLLGGSSLLSPCWSSISLKITGPWASSGPPASIYYFAIGVLGLQARAATSGSCTWVTGMKLGSWS